MSGWRAQHRRGVIPDVNVNDFALHLLVVALPVGALAALIIVANVSHRWDHAKRDRVITTPTDAKLDHAATSPKPNRSRPRTDKTRRALTTALGVALGVYAVSELA